jgi:hypothetical protein
MIKIGLGLGSTYFSPARSGSSSPAGTYEVTVQPIEDYNYYAVGVDDPAYYLLVSKTATKRWLIGIISPDAGGPSVATDSSQYTDYVTANITPGMTALQVATAIFNALIANTDLNVTRSGSTLTFTASQVGNLTDSVGFPTPTITNGTP